jgi:hypothetical protein
MDNNGVPEEGDVFIYKGDDTGEYDPTGLPGLNHHFWYGDTYQVAYVIGSDWKQPTIVIKDRFDNDFSITLNYNQKHQRPGFNHYFDYVDYSKTDKMFETRELIKKILKEEQEWFEEIKPMEVYLPWLNKGIEGLEEWGGIAYQKDDEIGDAIRELKFNPTKKNVRTAIGTILKWKGFAYVEGDDFDWSLDYLKMSIDPYSWKRFNIFDKDSRMVRGYSHSAYQDDDNHQ